MAVLREGVGAHPRLVRWGTADKTPKHLREFARAVQAPRRIQRLGGRDHPLDPRALEFRLNWLEKQLGLKGQAVPPATAPE